MNFLFFWGKKKLKENEAKVLLEEMLSMIYKEAGLNIQEILKSMLRGFNIPIDIPIPQNIKLEKAIAKLFVNNISDEKAYVTLKRMKEILDKYKI